MKALYQEGDGWLHRRAPRTKLIGLMLFSVALFLTRNPVLLLTGLAAAGCLLSLTGLSLQQTVKRLRPVVLTILIVAVFNLVFATVETAAVTLFRLSALMLAATAVTATTSIDDFMSQITLAARPLEMAGLLRAADIGLAVGLVIRFVPEIASRYGAIRDAHRARGLRVRLHTVLVPLIVATLKDADAIAAAIDARGIRRHNNHTPDQA